MKFWIGQKVVCVRDDFDPIWDDTTLPIAGQVYTVRDIRVFRFLDAVCGAIYLEEIENEPFHWLGSDEICEVPFWVGRFRPLVENKTDIGFAHEILRKVSKTKEMAA